MAGVRGQIGHALRRAGGGAAPKAAPVKNVVSAKATRPAKWAAATPRPAKGQANVVSTPTKAPAKTAAPTKVAQPAKPAVVKPDLSVRELKEIRGELVADLAEMQAEY